MTESKTKKDLQITFGDITEKNLGQVKILNSVVFPVRYNDRFYTDLLASVDYCKLAYHNDALIGAVCCRLERPKENKDVPKENQSSATKLYIMTLGVLTPYRGYGVGSKLMEHVNNLCKERPNVESIYLHVQTSNEEGINFYKRYGFEIVDTIKGYYKKIDPPDCYVLQKKLK